MLDCLFLGRIGPCAVVLLLSGLVLPAWAQLDEVVVTAKKRESSLQETPLAVTALSGVDLEKNRINNILDVQLTVPNVHFSKDNFNGANFSIRGVGNSALSGSADNSAGVHVNGMYLNSPRLYETQYYDLERIEVLRGPQGTLYGRNTTAGVMNIITARPAQELGADMSLTLGNYDTREISGMVNLPLADGLAQRVAFFSLDRDGYTENLYTGNQIDDRDTYGVRGSTQWDLSENLDALLVLSKFREDDNRSRVGKQLCRKDPAGVLGCLPTGLDYDVWNSNAGISGAVSIAAGLLDPGTDEYAESINPPDLRQVYADYDPQYFAEQTLASLEVNYKMGGLTFTSITGYSQSAVDARGDYDWTVPSVEYNYPVVDFYNGESRQTVTFNRAVDEALTRNEQVSQEFRLASNYSGQWDFTAGLFALHHHNERRYIIYFPAGYQYGQLTGLPLEQSRFDNDTRENGLESWALFGEGYWKWSADTTLTVGLRYTDEQKDTESRQILLDFKDGVDDPYIHQANDWQEWTGRIALDSQLDSALTDDTLLYASASRGYKGGGFNPPGSSSFESTFEPEYINALELGSKNQLLERRLRANLGLFFYDYDGLQVSKIVEQTAVNENVDARIWGAEAEIRFLPDEHWLLGLDLAYLNTEIGDFRTFDPADPAQTGSAAGVGTRFGNNFLLADPSSPGIEIDLESNQLPSAPSSSVTVHLAYTAGLGESLTLTPRVQYYWQDEFYARMFNTAKDRIDSWSLLNVQLLLEAPRQNWSLQAWVKNLQDDDYVTGHYTADPAVGLFTNVFLLEPRTYGLTFHYEF